MTDTCATEPNAHMPVSYIHAHDTVWRAPYKVHTVYTLCRHVACIYVFTYVCMEYNIYNWTIYGHYVHTHTHTHTNTHTHTDTHTHTQLNRHRHRQTHTHTHTHTHYIC